MGVIALMDEEKEYWGFVITVHDDQGGSVQSYSYPYLGESGEVSP